MKKIKVLISGSSGQLGQMLVEVLKKDFDLAMTDRDEMDICDKKKVREVFAKEKPEVIIQTAAYVDVDGAEDNIRLCNKINKSGSSIIAKEAKRMNSVLIHISTDYVFDGKKRKPYTEKDKTCPLAQYGNSKLLGESEIIKVCEQYYILRVAWLFGENKLNKNFVELMIDLAKQGKELKVIDDQIGSPTYTRDLSEIIAKIIKRLNSNPLPFGIYNFSGSGETSRYGQAKEIFRLTKIDANLKPIKTKDFFAKAERPKYSYLDKAKLEKALNIKVRSWKLMLKDYLKRRKLI